MQTRFYLEHAGLTVSAPRADQTASVRDHALTRLADATTMAGFLILVILLIALSLAN